MGTKDRSGERVAVESELLPIAGRGGERTGHRGGIAGSVEPGSQNVDLGSPSRIELTIRKKVLYACNQTPCIAEEFSRRQSARTAIHYCRMDSGTHGFRAA